MIIILIIYYITKTEHLYPFIYSLGTAFSPSLSSVYSYYTCMTELTKRSHVAPKMQHVTFCDSIVRFDWCRTKRIDTVCGVTWIPLCARDWSVIAWCRGEGEILSIHLVSTQCASGLNNLNYYKNYLIQYIYIEIYHFIIEIIIKVNSI